MPIPPTSSSFSTYRFEFPPGQLSCANCTQTVRAAIKTVEGIDPNSIRVSFIQAYAEVSACVKPEKIIQAINDAGYTPRLVDATKHITPFDFDVGNQAKKYGWRSLIAALFGIPLLLIEMLGLMPGAGLLIGQALFAGIAVTSAAVMWYCGKDIYKDAFYKALKKQTNMNSLVTLGSVLALVYSVLLITLPTAFPMLAGMHMSLCAGVIVLAIVNLGLYLKERAKSKATADLPKMREQYLRLQPATAIKVKANGKQEEIPFSEIKAGDEILVEAAHYFPVDGKIISPQAQVLIDERTMTGEKTARLYTTGDHILSGTLFKAESHHQQVLIQASCNGKEGSFHSMMSKVAQAMTSDIENESINHFLKWFTPGILGIALTAGLLWFFFGAVPSMGLGVFLAVLLCACPCALGLAAPIAYSTAINAAFKHHIIIRHADALDRLAKVKAVAFDMTGTLTEDEMHLKYRSLAISDGILQALASIEAQSKSLHPMANAIIRANKLPRIEASELVIDAKNRGISGRVNDKQILIGNSSWLKHHRLEIPASLKAELLTHIHAEHHEDHVLTTSYIAIDQQVVGYLIATQALRKGAKATIGTLNQQGIETILLTGAQTETAEIVAQQLKVRSQQAQQTPQDKKTYLESFTKQVAFIGDDPNDFPALTAHKTVGISVHPQAPAAGLAELNLSGSISDLLMAIHIAKVTRSNIHFSLGFMVIYNLISIALAAGLFFILSGVLLNPILASALMGLSSLTVVISGMSLRFFIERKFNPRFSLKNFLIQYWQNTSSLNKIIQLSLSLFSLLLMSTIIANVTLGFSWTVIFNSMILACTCCTGIPGILSAVGLFGLGITLVVGLYAFFRNRPKNNDRDSNSTTTKSTIKSVSDTRTKATSTASKFTSISACSSWYIGIFKPVSKQPLPRAIINPNTARACP